MQWSQLKKRIEDTFADSVKGRLEVWVTRYRRAHDQYGEGWITLDKQKIMTMGALTFLIARWEKVQRLREERGQYLYDEATKDLHDAGIFDSQDFARSMFSYLNLSIDDALKSENPIIRAFAMVDKRFGKRRLCDFDPTNEHPLVSQFYRFRCHAEGLNVGQPPTGDREPGEAHMLAEPPCQTNRD